MPSLARATSLAAALGLLAWASISRADPCGVRFVPPMNGSVPANAPALLAYTTPDGSDGGIPPALTVRALRGPTTSSPVTLQPGPPGPTLIRFDNALREEGASSIDYTLGCGDGGGGGASWPVVVGDAMSFPTVLGVPSSNGGGVGAVVTITPIPNVVTWGGLLRIMVTVDDKADAVVTSFGVVEGAPFAVSATGKTLSIGKDQLTLSNVCTTSTTSETHTYALQAEIAGAAALSDPIALTFDIECPGADGGVAPPPVASSGSLGDDVLSDSPRHSSGGCAVTRPAPAAGEESAPLGVLVGGALFLLRARRRALVRRSWGGRFWGI